MNKIIKQVRNELKANADEQVKKSSQRFCKEKVKFHGVKSAIIRKIAKDCFLEIKNLSKKEIFALCQELYISGFCEEAGIAGIWADRIHDRFSPGDFKIFERWINKYIDNWATCDNLCNHAVGSFIQMYPDCLARLKRWTKSKNRWLRRAAAVTLIIPARKGKFLKDIFEIAGNLLTDEDDMVQKGYGWMLKEASRKHQAQVFDFVVKNKANMPRTALRYAIEKMPANLRKQAMAK
ncbi:MAG: DNA alkylation repair protein [Phycisphaerae bacterium]|nr:DNA alkylation repair protein [Phycisphaerae bacterium]